MLSFPLLCRSRSFAVPAKVTLTCFFALVGLAVFVLGTALSPAQAQYPGGGYPGTTGTGHYDVSYSVTAGSGSTATYTTSGYPGSGASVSGTDSNSCYTSYGSSPTTYHIAAKSAITATFTWNNENNPANLPPSCAIIGQGSSASWSAQAQGCVPTGDCDPGLPNPVYTSGYLSKSGTATLYTVKSGSGGLSRITLAPVTPTASSDGTSGSAGGSGANGTVNVSYTASATPVTITPSGTTLVNGAREALTGQQVVATLNAPYPVYNGSYTWSSGGDVFKTYNENATSNQLVYLSDQDYYQSTFSFYAKVAETLTVTCTATLIAPDGTQLNVSPQQSITVLKPSVTIGNIVTGYVRGWVLNGSYVYGLAPDPSTSNSDGVIWKNVTIAVPTPFSGGQGCFTQLVTPDREQYVGTTASPVVPNNKQQGLDGSFLYGPAWTLPALGGDVDDPSITGVGTSNPNGLSKTTANDSFTTWIMYRPPANGQGTVWVPLSNYTWNWSATVSWQNNQWALTSATPANAAAEPNYTFMNTNDPPQWNLVH